MSHQNTDNFYYSEERQTGGGIDGFRIKTVLHETLLALTHKLFRLECPPERHLKRYQQIMEKALQPTIRQKNWESIFKTLSVFQQESLATQCIERTVNAVPTSIDAWLTVLMALEDLETYQADTLLHADLSLLATYHQGGLHGERFRASGHTSEKLQHLLQAEGYNTHYFTLSNVDNVALLYWLSRRLQFVWPWQSILALLPPQTHASRWLSLYRYQQIANILSAHPFFSTNQCSPTTVTQGLEHFKTLQVTELNAIGQMLGVSSPLRVLVLVEGNTEVLVLPAIAKTLGIDLTAEGIEVIPVGGKSQMLNAFLNFTEILKVPIVVVLDQDASALKPDLDYYCRPHDRIVLLSGEIEDTYSQELIEKTIHQFYLSETIPIQLEQAEAPSTSNTVGTLEKFWQQHGLGRFHKITFATQLSKVLQAEQMVSPAMKVVIEQIFEAREARNKS